MDVIGTPAWTSAVDNVWNKLSRPRREHAVEGTAGAVTERVGVRVMTRKMKCVQILIKSKYPS